MHTDPQRDRRAVEDRFAGVFEHLDFIVQYARRRGARDPDGIAAEAMAIAWGAVACQSVAGPGVTATGQYQPATASGPPVKVLLGSDGTDVIPAGGTGAGTVHLTQCVAWPSGPGTQVGNSGAPSGS